METAQSDALVFFGASGDLAFKQIFPALLGLVAEEGIDVPIVGVAKAGWTVEQLRARAKESVESHGSFDAAALARLTALMRYVDGDYNDPKTFSALKQALGSAKRPVHYLAIPPSLFGVVCSALAESGLNVDARLVVEKPFGHDRESARRSTGHCSSIFPRRRSSASTTIWARSRFRTSSTRGSQIRRSSRCGTATMSAASRSRWRNPLASRTAGASTTQPAPFSTWFRTTCCRSWPP